MIIFRIMNSLNLTSKTLEVSTCYDENSMSLLVCPDKDVIDQFLVSGCKILNIIFTVDVSGSMSELMASESYENQKRIDSVITAIIDVLNYLNALAVNGHKINVTILTFNENVNKIVQSSNITIDCELIVETLCKIKTNGSTNIGKALAETENEVQLLIENNKNSETIVYFITDGYDVNSEKNKLIIENFKMSANKNMYYGIGLGVIGDYDNKLMEDVFDSNFVGCPLSSDAVNTMNSIIIYGSSTLIRNPKFTFSDNVKEKYDIYSYFDNDEIDGSILVDKINIATKIPICLKLKDAKKHDFSSPIYLHVSGNDINGNPLILNLELPIDNFPSAESKIYETFFSYSSDFEQLIDVITKLTNKLGNQLTNLSDDSLNNQENIFIKIQNTANDLCILDKSIKTYFFSLPMNHPMIYLYKSLIFNISSYKSEIDKIKRINISELNDDEFNKILSVGKNMLKFMTSIKIQNAEATSLSREISMRSNSIYTTASKKWNLSDSKSSSYDLDTYAYSDCDEEISDSQTQEQTYDQVHNQTHSNVQLITEPSLKRSITVKNAKSVVGNIVDDQLETISKINTEDLTNFNYTECVICATNKIEVMSIPCKHIYACISCSRKINDCAICKEHVIALAPITIGESSDTINTINSINTTNPTGLNDLSCSKKCGRKADTLYVPCRHVDSCEICSKDIDQCGKCNEKIKKRIRVF